MRLALAFALAASLALARLPAGRDYGPAFPLPDREWDWRYDDGEGGWSWRYVPAVTLPQSGWSWDGREWMWISVKRYRWKPLS